MKLEKSEITKLIKELEKEKRDTIRSIDDRIKGLRVLQQNIGYLTGQTTTKRKRFVVLNSSVTTKRKRRRGKKRVRGVSQIIETQFSKNPGYQTVSEVTDSLLSSGFKSSSKNPKAMISGIVLKLFKEKKLTRKKQGKTFAYQILKPEAKPKPNSKSPAQKKPEGNKTQAAKKPESNKTAGKTPVEPESED
jgi:hypothetical protein